VSHTVTYFDGGWPEGVDVMRESAWHDRWQKRWPSPLRAWGARITPLQYALYLLGRARRYDCVTVGRYGLWYPLLCRLLRRRQKLVVTDTEWRPGEHGWLKRRAFDRADAVCGFDDFELAEYQRVTGLPAARFHRVLLAFQEQNLCPAGDDGYVFAGGRQGRDWPTFLQAVQDLPHEIRLFAHPRPQGVPAHIQVRQVPRMEYNQQIARAACVVVPSVRESMRATGGTTWVTAMAMGKVVITTDPRAAPDYMENGVSGFYLDYGDAAGLRTCIARVMADPELRARVGAAARERAWREFSPPAFRQALLAVVHSTLEQS